METSRNHKAWQTNSNNVNVILIWVSMQNLWWIKVSVKHGKNSKSTTWGGILCTIHNHHQVMRPTRGLHMVALGWIRKQRCGLTHDEHVVESLGTTWHPMVGHSSLTTQKFVVAKGRTPPPLKISKILEYTKYSLGIFFRIFHIIFPLEYVPTWAQFPLGPLLPASFLHSKFNIIPYHYYVSLYLHANGSWGSI